MSLRSLTYIALVALPSFVLACGTTTTGTNDEGEDNTPATPIEADAAATMLAEQICNPVFSCDCAQTEAYTNVEECVTMQRQLIQSQLDTYLDAGGSWDAQCAGEMAKAISKWECLGPSLAQREATFDPRTCQPLTGVLTAGSECSHNILFDQCAVGLSCVSGECVADLDLPLSTGSLCEVGWETLPCESGSYCAYQNNSDGQWECTALPVEGDSCAPNFDSLCGPASRDLICDPDSSTCKPAPGEDEPCFNGFLCGPGTYCDGGQDFTCQARGELGDGCGADAVCPVDGICVNNICIAADPAVCNTLYWFN